MVIGLAAAVFLSLMSLGALFGVANLGVPSMFWLFLVEDAVGFLVVGIGLMGFVWLRMGRNERGAAHAACLRRATMALILTVASEGLIFVTGLVLGYGILPHAIVVSGTFPPQVTPEWILTMAHFAGYVLVAVFVGLFLLWNIWDLSEVPSRWMGLTALVLGVPTHVIAWVSVSHLTDPMAIPVVGYYVSWVLPVSSVSLWLVAYVLVLRRLRGPARVPVANALPL